MSTKIILLCMAIFCCETNIIRSQNMENIGPQPTLSPVPTKSLRIIFEGTFQKNNKMSNLERDVFTTSTNSSGNNFISTNPYDGQNQLIINQSYPYFGSYNSGSNIKFGFDAIFRNKSGRRFILASRTILPFIKDQNFNSKETWFMLRTEGPKTSSIAIDFNIRIIR